MDVARRPLNIYLLWRQPVTLISQKYAIREPKIVNEKFGNTFLAKCANFLCFRITLSVHLSGNVQLILQGFRGCVDKSIFGVPTVGKPRIDRYSELDPLMKSTHTEYWTLFLTLPSIAKIRPAIFENAHNLHIPLSRNSRLIETHAIRFSSLLLLLSQALINFSGSSFPQFHWETVMGFTKYSLFYFCLKKLPSIVGIFGFYFISPHKIHLTLANPAPSIMRISSPPPLFFRQLLPPPLSTKIVAFPRIQQGRVKLLCRVESQAQLG